MDIPEGYCQCGCGRKTNIAKVGCKSRGRVRGKPLRLCHGHANRKVHAKYEPALGIKWGECHCGCGGKTKIKAESCGPRGYAAGDPQRYLSGHHNRSAPVPYIVDENTGCWLWQWSKSKKGYGRMRDANGRNRVAHRVYYEERFGPVDAHCQIDHLCKNASCVNPDHMEAVSAAENVRRTSVAVINVHIARKVKEMLGDGVCQADVSRALGISYAIVHQIKNGRTWRDA